MYRQTRCFDDYAFICGDRQPRRVFKMLLSLSVYDGKGVAKGRILSRMETSVRRSYVRFRSPKRCRSRCRRCPIHQSESSRIGHVDQGAAHPAGTCGEDQIAEQDYFNETERRRECHRFEPTQHVRRVEKARSYVKVTIKRKKRGVNTYFATRLGAMVSVANEDGNSGSPVPRSC